MRRASRSETWAMFGTLLLVAGLALPLACGDDEDGPTTPGDPCSDPNVSCDGNPSTAARGGVGGRGGTGGKGGTGGAHMFRDGGPRPQMDGSNRGDDAGADDAGPGSNP